MNKITLKTLNKMKLAEEKIACLTAYDFSFAKLLSGNDIDIILVGDSLGMVVQGNENTTFVTVDQMAYHVSLVKKGAANSFLMADLPFMSYSTLDLALQNSSRLMQAGAEMIKMEGGDNWLLDIVQELTQRGIPVCGHLGLTPQSVNMLGGFGLQGKTADEAQKILVDAKALEKAGAKLLVLECIPSQLALQISKTVRIPTIGIGAGVDTDGQILVTYDLLNIILGKKPKFVKNYMLGAKNMQEAIINYVKEVKEKTFPQPENIYL